MDVFISWSGKQSHNVGRELFEWLKETVPGVAPWLSSDSVAAGSDRVEALNRKLKESRFYVICLTPENARSPWIYFEAGVIAARHGKGGVCGYLAGVDSSRLLGGPLSLFQWVEANKEGTWKLVREINRGLEHPNDEKRLGVQFDQRWPVLKRGLEKALVETSATGVDADTEELKPVYQLSAQAETLLMEAAADPHGRVLMLRSLSGFIVQANGQNLSGQADLRAEANWQGAVRQLLQKGLLASVGSKGEVFRVTAQGYKVADDLKAQRNSASATA